MEETDYWRLKCKIAELRLEKMNLQVAMENINKMENELLKEAGLDPNKLYRFDDSKFEFVEVS